MSVINATAEIQTTTFRSPVYQIRSKIRNASRNVVQVYSFNVPEEQLESAHKLLDKEQQRRSMRVTYNLHHNFVVRHLPGRVHGATARYWDNALTFSLNRLISIPPEEEPPGCEPIGSTTFDIGPRKKQPDGGVRPTGSDYPSVVLEVGSSESLSQLRLDAQLWLELTNYVNIVVLICIDPPLPPSTTPRITFQLWRPVAPVHPPQISSDARARVAEIVQNDDWTLNETPVRLLLSEIFREQVPAAYGGHNYVDINTQRLRQNIINAYP